jgi:hypothetical protein
MSWNWRTLAEEYIWSDELAIKRTIVRILASMPVPLIRMNVVYTFPLPIPFSLLQRVSSLGTISAR